MVRGPGQNARMSAAYAGEGVYDDVEGRRADSMLCEETCTMRGLSAGLPFVEKILDDAVASNASAPRPYTVSVGKATTSRSFINLAASFMAFSVEGSENIGSSDSLKDIESGRQSSTSAGAGVEDEDAKDPIFSSSLAK